MEGERCGYMLGHLREVSGRRGDGEREHRVESVDLRSLPRSGANLLMLLINGCHLIGRHISSDLRRRGQRWRLDTAPVEVQPAASFEKQ